MKNWKIVNNRLRVDGFYIKDAINGFLDMGSETSGEEMLEQMGLPTDVVPFDMAEFLRNREIYWKDSLGRIAFISFKMTDDEIVCFGSYLGNKQFEYMNREWDDDWGPTESLSYIAHTESSNILNSCMNCISEKMIGDSCTESYSCF